MGGKASVPAAPDYQPLMNAVTGLAQTDQGLLPGEMGLSQQGTNLENTSLGQAGVNQGNANTGFGISNNQQGWANQAYGQNQGVVGNVEGQNLGVEGQNNNFATGLQNQFESETSPLMSSYAANAENYGSAGNIAQQMGLAGATTAQGMDQSRQNSIQDLEGFGIDPTATRYAGLDAGLQSQKAAAVTGAENTARQNTVQTGLGLEQTAIGQGQNLAGMAAGTQNVGIQAGSSAVNSGLGLAQSGANTMGTGLQWAGLGNQSEGLVNQNLTGATSGLTAAEGGYNLANGSMNAANGAYGAAGQMMNAQYQNQIQAAQLQNQENSQLMGGIGMIGGMFLAKGGAIPADDAPTPNNDGDDYGSYNKQTGGPFHPNKWYVFPGHDATGKRMTFDEAVKRFIATGQHHGVADHPDQAWNYGKAPLKHSHKDHFATGGTVGYAGGGGIDERGGGQVPYSASPSRGAVTDDVPGQTDGGRPLQLNAGEFVFPREAAHYYGEKHLQGMIDKARKAKTGGAQPPGKAPSSAIDTGDQ